MKTGRTIQEMASEIMRQSKAKEDYLVNTGSLFMEVWDGHPMLHLRDAAGEDLADPLDIQSTAHRQIGDYLEIPRKYYRRMLSEDAGLLAYNVNRWLQRNPEQRMIRTMDGRARAFLSNRYRRIDNLDIATITLPIIGEMKEAVYASCELTEDYMYIKVGRIASTDDDFQIYSQETLDADDHAFVLKLQDTVRAAVDEAKFAAVLDKMRQSKEAKLNKADIPSVVKLASSSFKITEAESAGEHQPTAAGPHGRVKQRTQTIF